MMRNGYGAWAVSCKQSKLVRQSVQGESREEMEREESTEQACSLNRGRLFLDLFAALDGILPKRLRFLTCSLSLI